MSLLVALVLLQGCGPGEEREYWGKLYFGSGAYLGQLDLRNGNVSLLANLGDTVVREVAEFGDEQLLLSVYGPLNQRDTFRLMHYKLDGGGLATLFTGRHGRFLPRPEALVFDDGVELKIRLYGGRALEKAVVTRHRLGTKVDILQVSETQFIYGIAPDRTIHSFDVERRVSRPLPGLMAQCPIDGALWIEARDALLCKRGGEAGDYAFVSLSGEVLGSLKIDDAEPFRAVAYLRDQDAIVLSEAWNTVVGNNRRYAIWIYDLSDDRMIRLAKNQALGSHVVYRAD